MKSRLTYLFALVLALLLTPVMAQEVISGDDYDLGNVEPVGGVDSAYEPYDGVDTGAIVLRQSTPTDQEANFDVVGPFDYWEHFDFADDPGEDLLLEDLVPGFYSVAATDEGLELAHTVVEVRAGESVAVDANLNAWDETATYAPGSYDPYTTYGTYEGYEDVYPGYPYGAYTVGPYTPYGAAEVGSISISGVGEEMDVVVTGPNGYSQGFESDTVIEGLPPGVYAVAASGEGTDLSATTVEVQGGQQLPVTPGMSSMEEAE